MSLTRFRDGALVLDDEVRGYIAGNTGVDTRAADPYYADDVECARCRSVVYGPHAVPGASWGEPGFWYCERCADHIMTHLPAMVPVGVAVEGIGTGTPALPSTAAPIFAGRE